MSTRNVPRRLVDELQALADQLAAGELPERGVAAELGRKVEATLNERRPKRKPANRSKQAWLLARQLSERTGVRVEVSYSPYKGYDGKVTGWRVEWPNGPADLRPHAAALAGKVPALDVNTLRYERTGGDRARVAALIRHLDANPDDGPAYAATNWLNGLAERAWEAADYPERMDDETERLVTAVFSLDGHDYTNRRGYWSLSSISLKRLAEQINHLGWPATRQWLAGGDERPYGHA